MQISIYCILYMYNAYPAPWLESYLQSLYLYKPINKIIIFCIFYMCIQIIKNKVFLNFFFQVFTNYFIFCQSLEILTESAVKMIIPRIAGESTNTNILLDCELLTMLMYVSETSHCFQLICHAVRASLCSRSSYQWINTRALYHPNHQDTG